MSTSDTAPKPPAPSDPWQDWLKKVMTSLLGRAWRKAPQSITTWGYAALVFLSVVAIATSLIKSNFASFILTMTLMFGLFVLLWAFGQMIKAQGSFWPFVGRISASVLLVAIIGLFCAIFLYMATGYPTWMDRWFSQIPVSAPDKIHIKTGAKGAPDPRTSVTVAWDRNVPAGTDMEVSIRKRGFDGEFSKPVVEKAEHGSARIEKLDSGTRYEIRVVAIYRSRRSEPRYGFVATDADRLQLEPLNGFERFYSGKLLPDSGVPEDEDGELILSNGQTGQPRQWLYRGSVSAGLPSGSGTFETDPFECNSAACGSRCQGTFGGGSIQKAQCGLYVSGLQVPEGNARIVYGGTSRYAGGVVGASKEPSAWVGPFPVWFDGPGTLEAVHSTYSRRYRGTWSKGRLESGDAIGEESGSLSTGQTYTNTRCILTLTPMARSSVAGAGGVVTCRGIELGEYRGGRPPYRGFESSINSSQRRYTVWYAAGERQLLERDFYDSEQCDPKETWGLRQIENAAEQNDWKLACDRSDGRFICRLSSSAIDLSLVARKPVNAIPLLEFQTSGNARSGDTPISINRVGHTLPPVSRQFLPGAYALAAEMCAAPPSSTIRNVEIGQEVSLKGFCPTLALMFNTLYSCSPPLGHFDAMIGDPDLKLFDREHFLVPAIDAERKSIDFTLLRLNEGFYTQAEMVEKLSVTVIAGERCDSPPYKLEFFLPGAGYSYGLSRQLSDGKWLPSILRAYLGDKQEHLKWLQESINKPAFTKHRYGCFQSNVALEQHYRFTFHYDGTFLRLNYRLSIAQDEPPQLSSLSLSSNQAFSFIENSAAERMKTNIGIVFPREVAYELDQLGLPTNFRNMN